MPDAYETFVRWYLRFNGYLSVENYVLHKPTTSGVSQGGEFDILAVRFPHSREVPGFRIENDRKLLDREAVEKKLIDFVIAEVKGRQKISLNEVWRPPDPDGSKRKKLKYLAAWLGPIDNSVAIRTVASELQAQQRSVSNGFLFRLVYFARRKTQQAVPSHVPQITFRDIAEFFVNVRAPCWQDHGMGVRSAHDQWDDLIKRAWEIGDPAQPGSPQEKVASILALLGKP
ncbi:MAG: hypothetical protein L0387_40095 [Acidobacteria bacterium]|nr:hypothetical protein [Acidobacteriota bacterium]